MPVLIKKEEQVTVKIKGLQTGAKGQTRMLILDQSNDNADIWVFTQDLEAAAQTSDIIFGDDDDDAIDALRKHYGEGPQDPITCVQEEERYWQSDLIGATVFKNKWILKTNDPESVAAFVKKHAGKVKLEGLDYFLGCNHPENPQKMQRREALWAHGISFNMQDNTARYSPSNAKRQQGQYLGHIKRQKKNNKLLVSHFFALVNEMQSAIRYNSGLGNFYQWRRYRGKMNAYDVYTMTQYAACLMAELFGKGSWRGLDSFRELKKRWPDANDQQKNVCGKSFVKWLEAEMKLPIVNKDLKVRKGSLAYRPPEPEIAEDP